MRNYIEPKDWQPLDGIELTKEQEDIVKNNTTNSIILAGPGTGKTEVLAQKITYLLETKLCHPHLEYLHYAIKKMLLGTFKIVYNNVANNTVPIDLKLKQ